MNPLENRQSEIAKALENLEKFRLNKMILINGEKGIFETEQRFRT